MTSAQTLDTPVVTIDLDVVEANIARLQAYLDQHGIKNRPHIKTHKIPAIATKQVESGAVGIACQKIGEAEVMAAAGLRDILLPFNILGPAKLERLMALAREVRLSVTVDSEGVARGLSEAARQAGLGIAVLIECDTGGQRVGLQSPEAALDLARRIVRMPGLAFGGLMTYPNSEAAGKFFTRALELFRGVGLPVPEVSGGGTPVMWQAHTVPGLTEHRAGTYVYNDRSIVRSGAATWEQCAMQIHATVVSRPTPGRAILDAGSKSLTSDLLGFEDYGHVMEYPEARLYALSEEHGHLDVSGCARQPVVGEVLRIIPNHTCVVSNLHDTVVVTRGSRVEGEWAVAARGKTR
ncbi:MAG TPA: D-TA family PLP-dependent enzyme [Candidatus Methylomirabilis sp.]|nr:D-TA family PLP-dependent enzyme [Candidatus Methylomirabilis sp.]